MTDYGHDLSFGIFVTPQADAGPHVIELAQRADAAGLDWVSVQDHPYQPAFLDAWTLLTAIAAATENIGVFPNVANLPLRPPAMLARAAASLDILSGGRVELGLGTGAFWDAIAAMGGPRRTAGESVDALREAIAVIRALWTPGHGARLHGKHYDLNGAKPGPFPVHQVGIWVGAYKERMLRLTGELADGWLPSSPYAPPEQLAAMNALIDAAATDAGRPPAAVRRIYNIAGSFDSSSSGFLAGPPKVWAEQLAGLALDEGMSGFVLMADDALTVERFAAEVAPSVRELVARERASAAGAPSADLERTAVSPGRSTTPAPRAAAPRAATSVGPATTAATTAATAMEAAAVTARGLRERLGVSPTPDDGVRLSAETVWDESARPLGPAPDPAASYSESDRSYARELVGVHNHLRSELGRLRDMISQVAAGSLDVATARSEINKLTMRQNQWTVGAYCESYCRLVGLHHTIESTQLFPGLSRLDGRWPR